MRSSWSPACTLVFALTLGLIGACVGRPGVGEVGETSGSGADTSTQTSAPSETTEEESESGPASESESEGESESEAESESDDGGPPPAGTPCDNDPFCAPGVCVNGICRECQYREDCFYMYPDAEICDLVQCLDFECAIGPRDCSMGDSCSVGYCDPDWQMDDSPLPLCQFEYCDMYDGIPELELRLTAVNFTPPPELDIGGEVMVYGYFGCKDMVVVRDLLSDELLLLQNRGVSIGAESYDQEMQSLFGRTMNELTAPLVIGLEDHGVCGIEEDNCGQYSRGAADVGLGLDDPSPARVLDETLGWASGGYMVNNRDLVFGDWDCIFNSIYSNRTFIARDACSGEACPAPTFEVGCVPEAQQPDRMEVIWDLGQASPESYLSWSFQCEVVEVGEGMDGEHPTTSRFLDCAAVMAPSVPYACED